MTTKKTSKPKAAAKAKTPKAPAKPKSITLKDLRADVSHNGNRPFSLLSGHAYMQENETCCIEGTLNGEVYFKGYTDKAVAVKDLETLNAKHF